MRLLGSRPHRTCLAAVAVALAAALVAPVTASARTLYVDDDGADCRQAAHSTVQGAVDAARTGDTVRVCRGTYPGRIVIPMGKDRLRLLSVARLGATLKPPRQGLEGGGRPWAIVVVLAERAVVRGFRIEGPLNFKDPASDCGGTTNASAVAVPQGSALIDSNRITNVVQDCGVAGGPLIGAGVHAGDLDCAFSDGFCTGARVEVDRNVIGGGTPNGVISEIASYASVQRNTIAGDGGGGRGVVLDSQSAGPLQGTVRSNDISGMDRAVVATGFISQGGRTLIRGNHLHHNGTGIDVFTCDASAEGEIRNNLVEHNGLGLYLHAGHLWRVQDNGVLDNSGDGIRVEGLPGFCNQGRHRLVGNRSLGNGGLDCRDETAGSGTAHTANIWQRNVGRTDSPDVCRAP